MVEKKTKQKVLIVDTYSQKSLHEMFNTSLILMLSMIFEKVDLRISKSSYENYLKIIDRKSPQNIKYKDVYVIEGSGRFKLLLRYLVSAFQNAKYLIISPKDTIIVFPYNNLFSIRMLNFLNKFFKKKILIFCHGEMEGIVIDVEKTGLLHRVLLKLSRNFFLNKNVKISDGIYFSVLGDVLKQNICKIIDTDKADKFLSVDHPYLFEIGKKNIKQTSKLNIATVGTMNKTKGLLNFVKFANKINPLVKGKVNISVIGLVSENYNLFDGSCIELTPDNKVSLSRNDFDNRVNDLDYILFFYPKDSYTITASGAIMDAINFEKPILALNNSYFQYIFSKYGAFGFLFDTVDEMVSKVEILSSTETTLNIDFHSLKAKLTPKALSSQLLNELIRIDFLKLD
ncbi:hypothetical protein AB9T89_18970 [Flavobacterium oncorhynchi]|uniref:hypothetical protein n=1 Tax=Flavobacterium oncorhynchi TaxID=728056 RepID=UPI003519F111